MACEKCWGDAWERHFFNPSKSQSEHYRDLLIERNYNPCTLKEQLGQFYKEDSDESDTEN
jgi:hypothetical protein